MPASTQCPPPERGVGGRGATAGCGSGPPLSGPLTHPCDDRSNPPMLDSAPLGGRPQVTALPFARAAAAGTTQLQLQQRRQQQQRLYATASPPSKADAQAAEKAWEINLLYDSDCPLCMKEVDFLRKRDVEGAWDYDEMRGRWMMGC